MQFWQKNIIRKIVYRPTIIAIRTTIGLYHGMRCQHSRVEVGDMGLLYFIFMQRGIGNYKMQSEVSKAGPEKGAFLPMRPYHAFLAEKSS